jgi:AraC family transcriptional regulator
MTGTPAAVGTEEASNAYKFKMRTFAGSLPYGVHFGASQVHEELPGFSVSLLTATLRAEEVPLHTHENASFVFVLSGAYLSAADGATVGNVGPTLIFNPAGTVHRDSFVRADGRFLAVSIADPSLRIASDWADLPASAVALTSGTVLGSALRLAQQCAIPGPASVSAMEAMCWELLSTVSGVGLWPNNHQTPLPSWIGRARELLHDRCSDTLRITEMAQQLGVHPVYFARAFRKAFHCTPGEYRMRCRLRDALALMKNASIPLSEIALKAGFFDQSHFSTAFRNHFGVAPQAHQLQRHGFSEVAEVQFVQEEMEENRDTTNW